MLGRFVEPLPNSPHAHYDLGTTLLNQKRLDEAAEHFDLSLRLKPDFSEAHNNRGAVHALQGKIDEAITSYAEALRLNESNIEARDNLAAALAARASVLAGQDQIDPAVAHRRREPQRNDDVAGGLHTLGC